MEHNKPCNIRKHDADEKTISELPFTVKITLVLAIVMLGLGMFMIITASILVDLVQLFATGSIFLPLGAVLLVVVLCVSTSKRQKK